MKLLSLMVDSKKRIQLRAEAFYFEFSPFQWDDAEICLRAYKKGIYVGLFHAKFKHGGHRQGGMRIWNSDLHDRQDEINAARLYKLYGDDLEDIKIRVDSVNNNPLI